MITRRFVFTGPGLVEWQERDVPDKPTAHGVLVGAKAAVISAGTDTSIYAGTHINIGNPSARWPKYPHSPGGHVAGDVLAVGSEVEDLREGDRLVFGGGYTRFHMLDSNTSRVTRIPDGVTYAQAVLASHSTVSQNGVRSSRVAMGENVVVFGLGLIGQYALQYARLSGAGCVMGIDPLEARRAIATKAGADVVLDSGDGDGATGVFAVTGSDGPEVIIEATGSPRVIPTALRMAGNFSRVVLLGSPRGTVEIDPYNDLHRKSISVIGSNVQVTQANHHYQWTRERNLHFALNMVRQGRLALDVLVTHSVSAEESLDIWERLVHRPGEHLGVILNW